MISEETKDHINQVLTESEHYRNVINSHGAKMFNEISYALHQAQGDTDLLMSVFEDSGMWKHAMCLNDILITNGNN